jgi:hypothetical protein
MEIVIGGRMAPELALSIEVPASIMQVTVVSVDVQDPISVRRFRQTLGRLLVIGLFLADVMPIIPLPSARGRSDIAILLRTVDPMRRRVNPILGCHANGFALRHPPAGRWAV